MSIGAGVAPFAALQRAPLFEGLDHEDLDRRCDADEAAQLRTRRGAVPGRGAGRRARRDRERPRARGAGLDGRGVTAKLRRGDAVGMASLVGGDPHPATVVAGMPTDVLELDSASFESVAERHPVVLRNVTRIVSRRLASNVRRAGVAGARRGGGADRRQVADARCCRTWPPRPRRRPRAASPCSTRGRASTPRWRASTTSSRTTSTVLVAARAEGRSAPLLLEHVDRALILVEDERDAAHFPARPGLEVRRVDLRARVPATGSRPAELAWLGRHLSGTKLGLALGAGRRQGLRARGRARRCSRRRATSSTTCRGRASARSWAPISRSAWTPREIERDAARELHPRDGRRGVQALAGAAAPAASS